MICGVCLRDVKGLREAHGGAKRAKHRAKRSPECADPKRSVGARPNLYSQSHWQALKGRNISAMGEAHRHG